VLHNCAKSNPRKPLDRNNPGKTKTSAGTLVYTHKWLHISELRKSIFLNRGATLPSWNIFRGPKESAFPQRFPQHFPAEAERAKYGAV
jgi:hypothetical protein